MPKKKHPEVELVQWIFTDVVEKREETEPGSASLVVYHSTDRFCTKRSLSSGRERVDAGLGYFSTLCQYPWLFRTWLVTFSVVDQDSRSVSSEKKVLTLKAFCIPAQCRLGEMEILAWHVGANNHLNGSETWTLVVCCVSALPWGGRRLSPGLEK